MLSRNQHGVTLRELLTHMAGTTVPGFSGYSAGETIPTLPEILDGLPPANSPAVRVDLAPGTRWRYSGGGYVVVQQLLQDVTGESFAKFMQQSVLGPLGMTHSTFAKPLPMEHEANAAIGYRSSGEPVEGGAHVYPEMAAAGLWTTADDLAAFAIAVQRALKGCADAIVSHTLAKEMVATRLGKRGLIFGTGGSTENPYFAHSGGNEGFESYLVAYQNGDGAVVTTNGDGGLGFDLILEIVRSIAKEYGWLDFHPLEHTLATVPPNRLQEYVGCYRFSSGDLAMVSRAGDHLYAQVSDGNSWQLFAEAETQFFSKFADAQVTFELDARGRAAGLVLRKYGKDAKAERLP